MNKGQPMTGSPTAQPSAEEEKKRNRRRLLLLLLILLLVPVCLWIVSQLALFDLGMDEANESLLSQLQATYAPWAPASFGPLDPTMIGTIRAEQATFAAGGGGIGILVPFVPGGPGETQIAANASPTPTVPMTGTATLSPTPVTPTATVVVIVYPGTPTITSAPPTPDTTTPGTPAPTDVPPTGVPPTATPIPPTVDLSITKDDGVTVYPLVGSVTYTITVSNPSAIQVNNARVTDNFPAGQINLGGIAWICVPSGAGSLCPAIGSGNLNNVAVRLGPGGSVTFTVTAPIKVGATGPLVNTATVTPPASINDPNLANNTATDTDAPPVVDLAVTKTDDLPGFTKTKAWPGGRLTYTIVASNLGATNATGATVADTFPTGPGLLGGAFTWTCTGTAGTSFTCPANGTTSLNDTVSIPVGGSITYQVDVVLSAAAALGGSLSNTATITPASGITDSNPADNSATDTDTIGRPNVVITLSWNYGEKDDFDLWVVDPSAPNDIINSPNNPNPPHNSSAGGTISSGDSNCANIFSNPASETVDWSLGFPRLGTYYIYAYYYQSCPVPPPSGLPVTWTVTVTVDGNVLAITPTPTGTYSVPVPVIAPPAGCPGLLMLPGGGSFVTSCTAPTGFYDPASQNPNYTATFTLQ